MLLAGLTMLLVACQQNPFSSNTNQNLKLDTSDNASADWAQFGHDASQTAANTAFTAVNASNIKNLGVAWLYHSDGPLTIPPAVVGNSVYLNTGRGSLLALDRTSGKTLWTFSYNGTSASAPAVAKGNVYFCTENGQCFAVASDTGKQVWAMNINRPIEASPLYSSQSQLIYIATMGDPARQLPPALLTLNPNNGETRWQYDLPTSILSDPSSVQAFRLTPPVAGEAFFMPNRVSSLSSGVVQIASDKVDANNVPGTNALSSASLLAQTSAGPILFSSVSHSGGAVAIPANQTLTNPYWYFDGPADAETNLTPHTGAYAANTYVYTADDFNGNTHLLAIDSKGQPRWDLVLNGKALASPIIAGSMIFMGDEAGTLHAFDLQSGQQLWSYQIESGVRTRAVAADDMIFQAASDGNLYAFSLKPAATAATYLPGQNNTLAAYAAPDSKGVGQIYGFKANQPVQLTTGDFALPDAQYSVPISQVNRSPAIAPDGSRIAFVSFSKAATKSALFVMNADGSNIQPLPDTNAEPDDLAWTADGQALMFVSDKDHQLYFYNFGSQFGGLHALTTNYYEDAHLPKASADNRYIYWLEADRAIQQGVGNYRLVRMDRDGQNLITLISGIYNLKPDDSTVFWGGLAVSPFTGDIFYVNIDQQTRQPWIWEANSQGSEQRRLVQGIGPLSFSPDGRLLYSPSSDSKQQVALNFDAGNNPHPTAAPAKISDYPVSWVKPDASNTTPELLPFQPYYFPATALQGLPYGKYVVSSNGAIYEADSFGVRLAQLTTGGANYDSEPQLTRDGKEIVFVRRHGSNGKPQIWVMDALGQNQKQLTTLGSNIEPAWSSDNKTIAFVSDRANDGKSNIWTINVAQGEVSAAEFTHTGNNYWPAYSPDGKFLIFTSDRNAKTATVDSVPITTTSMFQVKVDGSDLTQMDNFPIDAGLLGVSNIRFDANGRYISYSALRYTVDASGKFSVQSFVGVHDFLNPKDYNDNINCSGTGPAFAGGVVACIEAQPSKLMSGEAFAETEPTGTFARGAFSVNKKPDAPPLLMLDPRRYPVSGLSWSAS